MTDNTVPSFDTATITLEHVPPFAQRMREAADLVWEQGYRQPFIRELGAGTLARERFNDSPSTCCRITAT